MVLIEDYLNEKVDDGMKTKDIADELGITPAMVGQYRLKRGYKPSLTVAKRIYTLDGVVLHPFSEESLQFEIEKDS